MPRRPLHRPAWLPVAAALVLFAAGEMICRFGLGLGDPPLYQRHGTIEYLPRPGVYRRFGHRVSINQFYMRSTPIVEAPGERRVLVLGDSITHGGSKLDDSQIATFLLPGLLAETSPGQWRVLNASCGSWGPENLLEYVRRFGVFGAGVAVIVLNNADAWDVPTFGPLGDELPTRRPLSALVEALTRYLPRYLARPAGPAPEPSQADIDRSLGALRQLVALLRERGLAVAFVLHAERSELESGPARGTILLRQTATELGVPIVETGPEMMRVGVSAAYDGRVHLTAAGQEALARVLRRAVLEAHGR